MNLVTGAALATVNRLPVFLLPGDTYATRHQGPVLQQLQHPVDADLTVNDVFRPISRFFDRITRPEQLLTALPAAIRTLVDPVETGAVVLSLPQDVQSHAYDFPAEFFAERDWVIRRPAPDTDEIAAVAELLASARRSRSSSPAAGSSTPTPPPSSKSSPPPSGHRSPRPSAARAPCRPRRGGRSAASGWKERRPPTPWPGEADLVLTVGSRLTDFATGSHSIFANPDVKFASINVNVHDADRLGATGIVGDAKRALAALTAAAHRRGTCRPTRPGGSGSRNSPTPGPSSGRMR